MFQSKRWTRAFLYVATLAPDLVYGWPLVLVARLAGGEKLRWEDGVLRCRAKRIGLLQKTVGKLTYAVTLSPHAIIYTHQALWPEELKEPSRTQMHEHVHVEQGEATQLASLVPLGLIVGLFLALDEPVWAGIIGGLFWALAYLAMIGAALLTAWLRGEEGERGHSGAYVGSHAEEAARAQETGRPPL